MSRSFFLHRSSCSIAAILGRKRVETRRKRICREACVENFLLGNIDVYALYTTRREGREKVVSGILSYIIELTYL